MLSIFLKSSIGSSEEHAHPGLRGGTAPTFQLGPFSRTCRGLSSRLLLNLILYCLLVAEEHAIVLTMGERAGVLGEDTILGGIYEGILAGILTGFFKKDSGTKLPEGILDGILRII